MNHFFRNIHERVVGEMMLPLYETRLRRRKTYRHKAEFDSSQWLSPAELREVQWRKVQAILRHAYETVPFYREAFQAAGIHPDRIDSPAAFARIPVLHKSALRANKYRLVSSRFRVEDLIPSASGGSTGEPVQFYYNRDSYERRIAASMRADGWAGWRSCSGELHIWGVNLLPQKQIAQVKSWLLYAGMRKTVVNSFDLTPEVMTDRVADLLERLRPRIVIGFSHALYEIARRLVEKRIDVRPPVGVVAAAEKLYPHQRKVIEQGFGAPVYDRYGCREVMIIGAECPEHAGLHVAADNLYVEFARDGVPCEPDESGEVLLTDLHNYGMPLIRYRVGDVGSWNSEACRCGRGLPLMNAVEGRTLDFIRTPSGRLVSGAFFPHFLKDFPAVRAFQVLQERREAVTVRMTLEGRLSSDDESLVKGTIARTIGSDVAIEWQLGPDIVIERTRKFRPVISTVPIDHVADAAES
jgi:phenylacetate-CoA ligase